jgi:holdfast attachment protein HfaA
MAVAEWGATEMESPAMKKISALVVFALATATAAQAGDWTSSGMYNGYGASNMNTTSNYSMRDANGNLTMVNGMIEPSQVSQNSQTSYSGGVGTSSAQNQGQATAIGNSLNVTVVGSHNTTIIDSEQTNTGNQTATATLNSH